MVLCPDTVLNLDCAEYQVHRLDTAILGTVLVMLTVVNRQKVHLLYLNYPVFFGGKVFFLGDSGEVFPHLLACSIVQIG